MPRSSRPRVRRGRRLLRVARGFVVALLALTVGSAVFNVATTPPQMLDAPDGRDVDVAGTSVHYLQWGPSGRPIVLVHGFAESSEAWRKVASMLSLDHVVYAIDLAGFGYTQYTGRYSLTEESSLLWDFIETLGIRRPVLVGHSMGAAVVGSVALDHRDAIAGVVFADGDALPFGDPESASSGSRQPGWLLHLPPVVSTYRLVTRGGWLGERALRAQCGSRCLGLDRATSDAWLRPLRQRAAEQAMPTLAQQGVLHLTPSQIKAISVPRGIIWGAEDTSSGGSLALARQYLGDPTTVVIPAAGHLSMLADPVAFTAALQRLVTAMPD